jgi:Fe-S cluster assembly iron-binding protein IscA
MLQLSHAAAVELVGTRQAQGLPDTAGLRVFGEPTPEGKLALGVTFARTPAEDDQITEREGARVFVAPEVAGALNAAALDIKHTPEGLKLVITEQDPTDES